MTDVSPGIEGKVERLRIDAGGAVRALEIGAGSTAVAGILAGVAANLAAPIAVVAGLPVALGALGAIVGYVIGARDTGSDK